VVQGTYKKYNGDTARPANTDEVKDLRREAKDLKEVVAEQTLELRLLKKSMIDDGATTNEVRCIGKRIIRLVGEPPVCPANALAGYPTHDVLPLV
jgi:hypothetical protein